MTFSSGPSARRARLSTAEARSVFGDQGRELGLKPRDQKGPLSEKSEKRLGHRDWLDHPAVQDCHADC